MRWPGYTITGDGKIAVVLHCCSKVVLTDLLMEAQIIRDEACKAGLCTHVIYPRYRMHAIKSLETKPTAPRSFQPAFSLGWDD